MRYNEHLHMQRQTTGMSYLLEDKQRIQQITRPRMGKKRKPACNIQQVTWDLSTPQWSVNIASTSEWIPTIELQFDNRTTSQNVGHIRRPGTLPRDFTGG